MNTIGLTVEQLRTLLSRAEERGAKRVEVYELGRLVVEVTNFDPDEGPDETVIYEDGATNR